MAHGAERLAQELKTRIGEILLKEVRDPRVGFATVTSARLSPDHRYAQIFVSVLGTPEETKRTLAALKAASGFIRRQLSSRMRLRHTPELTFAFDPSVEAGARMEQLLQEVKKQADGWSAQESATGETAANTDSDDKASVNAEPPESPESI